MRKRRPLGWLIVAVWLTSVVPASPQNPPSNGVNVGELKVYDNRSLALMLDQLGEQLQTVRVVDQQRLLQALGVSQGAEARETARSFQLGTAATPSVSTTETLQEGTLGVSQRVTERAAGAATTPPAIPDLLAGPNLAANFTQNAQDLLGEQIDLSYRIFNLQMLLDRSLTDRIWKGEPRLQAVVGLEISIDPPKGAKDHIAVVEITLVPRTGGAASLVALMPEAKRYNTSALSTKSTAFGGSAVARMITVGYSERRRGQVFYVFQDADTIALERIINTEHGDSSLTFGWAFRPVLGRRSVAPGIRQLFAVIALPAADLPKTAAQTFDVKARTYWRKYDRSTLTGKTERRLDSGVGPLPPLLVENSAAYERALRAEVECAEWSATDDKTAVVTVTGKNFFPGTRVFFGPRSYDSPATGLTIKSDKTFELRTTIQEIASGEAVVSGRYGPAVLLEAAKSGGCLHSAAAGLRINGIDYNIVPGSDNTDVNVVVQEMNGGQLTDLPGHAVLSIGQAVFSSPYFEQKVRCDAILPSGEKTQADCLRLTYVVPSTLLAKDAIARIRVPFAGRAWSGAVPIAQDLDVYEARVIGGTPNVLIAISGRGFGPDWTVQLDRLYTPRGDPRLTVTPGTLSFLVPENALKGFTHVLVQVPNSVTIVVPLARGGPPKGAPALATGQAVPQTKVDSAGEIRFTGSNLGLIRAVKFGAESLPFAVNADGSELRAVLSRAVTAKAGTVVLLLEKEDKTYIPASLQIVP